MDVDIDVLMDPGPSCHVLRCANSGASNERGTRDTGLCLVSSARSARFWSEHEPRFVLARYIKLSGIFKSFPSIVLARGCEGMFLFRWCCAGNLPDSSI